MKVTRVSETVAEEYKLFDLEKVSRAGSDEADPNRISEE